MTDYPETAARFAVETQDHQMTVLLDQGLYRHLKFRGPRNELYWFEIVTSPGQLTFSGDGDSFVFRLADDMFEMFRRSSRSGGINAGYWAEKVRTGNARSYSRERFEEIVEQQVAAAEPRFPGLRDDVREFVLDSVVYDVDYEASALMAALDFEYRPPGATGAPFRFEYVHEWDLRDFDWWFLFACHAIVHAIQQYDAWRVRDVTRRLGLVDAVRGELRERDGLFNVDDVRGVLARYIRNPDLAEARAVLDRLTSDGSLARISHKGRVMWQAAP